MSIINNCLYFLDIGTETVYYAAKDVNRRVCLWTNPLCTRDNDFSDYLHCNLYIGALDESQFAELIKKKISFFNVPDISDQIFLKSYNKHNFQDYWLRRKIIAIPGAIWHTTIATISLLFFITLATLETGWNLGKFLLSFIPFIDFYKTNILPFETFKFFLEFLPIIFRELHMAGGYLYTLYNDVHGLKHIHRAYLETFCNSKSSKESLLRHVKYHYERSYPEVICHLANDKEYRDDMVAGEIKGLASSIIYKKERKKWLQNDVTAENSFKVFVRFAEKFDKTTHKNLIFMGVLAELKKTLYQCEYLKTDRQKEFNKLCQVYIKALCHINGEVKPEIWTTFVDRLRLPLDYDPIIKAKGWDENWVFDFPSEDDQKYIEVLLALDGNNKPLIKTESEIFEEEKIKNIIKSGKIALERITKLFADLNHNEQSILMKIIKNHPQKRINKNILFKIFPECARYFLKLNENKILPILCSVKRLKKENKLVLTKDMLVTILSHVITDAKDECQDHPMKLVAGDSGMKNLIKF